MHLIHEIDSYGILLPLDQLIHRYESTILIYYIPHNKNVAMFTTDFEIYDYDHKKASVLR
jgi:hypothetical protein